MTTTHKGPLVPIVNKQMCRTLRRVNDMGGPIRMECWGATSADGIWQFTRIEDTGTPWEITHRPSGLTVRQWFGTMRAARIAVASGWCHQDIHEQSLNEAGSS